MIAPKKTLFLFLSLTYFLSFSFPLLGILIVPHYIYYVKHSYLSGLFSGFTIAGLALVLIAPILEEFGFRGFFTKNFYLLVSSFSMFLTFIEGSIFYRFIVPLKVVRTPLLILESYEHIFYFFPENVLIVLIITKILKIDVSKLILNNKYFFVIIESIFFAFAHTTGLWAQPVPWFFPIIFVLPQFCFGLIASYIRINYNLLSSIILHFCYDSFLFLIVSVIKFPAAHVLHLAAGIISAISLLSFYVFGFFYAVRLGKKMVFRKI